MRFRLARVPAIVAVFLMVGQPLAASVDLTGPADFEVPDDYVGPVLDEPGRVEVLEEGFVQLDWFDPKGEPVVQYAAEFGVDAPTAVDLLRWQSDLANYLEELRSLSSYAYEQIVNPTPGSLGGLDVYLKEPSLSDAAFVDAIPSPPGGANRLRPSKLTKAEAKALVVAEKQRLASALGPDEYVLVDIDWAAGTVTGRIAERPEVTLTANGCAMSTQTGGFLQGGRAVTMVDPNSCTAPEGVACTSAFAVYFNGKQGILTAGHCLVDAYTGAFGVPQGQHFVSDTVEGLEVRCINPCSSTLKGYFNDIATSRYSRSRAYASLRPYYNDWDPDWDDYAVWRERYASSTPSGRIYVIPGGPNTIGGFSSGFYSINSYAKDSAFPGFWTWVCQAAKEASENGQGLYCGKLVFNPTSWIMTSSGRSVGVDYSDRAGLGPGGGSSGGPWFYDNIGLGVAHGRISVNGVDYGVFERIEPIFNQLKAVSSTSKLYCESSWLPGVTVACTP